jgi:hypothetical protein
MWNTRSVIRSSWLVATAAGLAVAVALGIAHQPDGDPGTRQDRRSDCSEYNVPGGTGDETVTKVEKLVQMPTMECRDKAAAMAGELARAYHAEGVRTESVETLGYAERLYAAYLGAFPDAADFAQTQYFRAELLWSRAEMEPRPEMKATRWANAAAAFTEVVKSHKVETKLLDESEYAAVLAAKNSRAR